VLRWLPGTLILASIVAGIVLAVAGQHTLRWSPPPVPPRTMALPRAPRAAQRANPSPATSHRAALPRPMTRSRPVSLAIPDIHLRAWIIPLGQAPDGAPAVPSLRTPLLTSWYDRGPTPGAAGTAIIFGHVDAATTGPTTWAGCAAATWSTSRWPTGAPGCSASTRPSCTPSRPSRR
jgi:hypothetical protein